MSITEAKDLSLLIYSTLNNFGFKKENVCLRANYLKEEKMLKNVSNELKKCGFSLHVMLVGSTGEGVGLSNSDHDHMLVLEDIICLEQGDAVENITILETDHSKSAPGYTKVVHKNTFNRSVIGNMYLGRCTYGSATSASGHSYVSSAKFRNLSFQPLFYKMQDGPHYETTINGPAVTFLHTTFETGQVFSFLFYGSEQLPKWANRTRYYSWPSRKCVREISEKEGYLVPVGDKQSANQDLEWRICYTTAEKDLIASLNDVQIKVYVLLKMVTSSVLKTVCKALTSYVVKNVVFWILEGTPHQSLTPDLIVYLIQKSLYFIKYCLENNHLPNYMIPERNLLRGALNSREKQTVINFLSDCLREGGTVLLRVPKLYQCVSYSKFHPKNVIIYGKWRDEVEKQIFLFSSRRVEIFVDNFLNNRCSSMLYDMENLFVKDARIVGDVLKLHFLVIPDMIHLLFSVKHLQELEEVIEKRMEMVLLL